MRHAIVVGAGQIGTAIAARLADDGWQVTVVSRGRRVMSPAIADRVVARHADHVVPGALAGVIGSGAHTIIDTIAYDADRLLDVQPSVGSIVAISSASVYADGDGRRSTRRARTVLPKCRCR